MSEIADNNVELKLNIKGEPKKKFKQGVKVKESWQYRVFQVFNVLLMLIICALTLYPFLYLVAQSFSSEAAIIKDRYPSFR